MITGKIIYLSGPMTGYNANNFPLFTSVTNMLRHAGNRVYSPHEYPNNWKPGNDVRKTFASYCAFICLEADTMVMLPGWLNSKGCMIEYGLAEKCKLEIHEWKHINKEMMKLNNEPMPVRV